MAHDQLKNNKPLYINKIKNGISQIKGGVHVLKQLQYPKKITNKALKILNTL